jgi:hypothetical protein
VVTGICGSQSSNVVSVDVYPATQITVQPINRTRWVDDNVTFSVIADGFGLSYQWYFNGGIIGVQLPIAIL